jgi:HD-GYP domain-containing protein (c-di-GMP phosphodiesterase class II)
MQIFDVANLALGSKFPEPLFHSSGRKLLSAKMPLTQLHINALVRAGIQQVYMTHSAREVLEFSNTPAQLMAVTSLVLGTIADTDFLTPDGVVIIQQNEQVEEHHLAALRDSHIDFLLVKPSADVDMIRDMLETLSHEVVSRAKALIHRGEYLRAPEALDPFIKSIAYTPPNKILNINALHLLRRRLSSRLQPVYGMLETGKHPHHQVLLEITEDLLDLMRSEPQQFSQLALMTAGREDCLPDHAISVAVLAMAIAAHMNLSLEMVKEVIIGALLCDVGMLALPKHIRSSTELLSATDHARVQQHPIYSLSMMEQIPALSPIPRLMAFQHHERLNGQGYPNRTTGTSISDFSRIVAVADIFAAAANPRAYKAQKLPYHAIEELVRMAHLGMIDPRVIKALLAAIGLFPVGSYVLLSTHTTAQVIGNNPAKIDRPLIRPLVPGENPANAPLINLAAPQYQHLKIASAVAPPTQETLAASAENAAV